RLTGETGEYGAVLRLRREPVDAERRSHNGQRRYALADGNVQRRRVTSYKEIGLRQQCCQRMQVPCRDERGVGTRCSSDRLHLGWLSWSPEQQYTGAWALAKQIDQGTKMCSRPLPGGDMMRGVDTDEEIFGCDSLGAQKGGDLILLTLGIGKERRQIG